MNRNITITLVVGVLMLIVGSVAELNASSKEPSPALADEEVAPYPLVTAAQGGRAYFKMVPDTDDWSTQEGAVGRAYRVGSKDDRLLWEVRGWYGFEFHLGHDGRYLVRMGDWPRGHQPSEDDLAIAFYDNGKLLRSYSTRELIKDDLKVPGTVSHYVYRDHDRPARFTTEEGTPDGASHWFEFTTIDGILYRFDIRSGLMAASRGSKEEVK